MTIEFLQGIVMFYLNCISKPQFPPIIVIYHNASSWTSNNRRLAIIFWRTALTPVDKEILPSTELRWILGVQIERAGSLGCLVHYVFAVAQFVQWCREWTNIIHIALFIRVQIPLIMPRIPESLNARLPLSPNKPPGILIESKMHRLPIFQSSAAVDLAVGLRLDLS